jgi:hypothetical protein
MCLGIDMRIWSVHPKYLDSKRLVAAWREALLARAVLKGKTKGYKHHPQLERFRQTKNPVLSINHYLYYIYTEAVKRGYNFDRTKLGRMAYEKIDLNDKQLLYEFKHLINKLGYAPGAEKLIGAEKSNKIEFHPIFRLVKGEIEPWERVINKL